MYAIHIDSESVHGLHIPSQPIHQASARPVGWMSLNAINTEVTTARLVLSVAPTLDDVSTQPRDAPQILAGRVRPRSSYRNSHDASRYIEYLAVHLKWQEDQMPISLKIAFIDSGRISNAVTRFDLSASQRQSSRVVMTVRYRRKNSTKKPARRLSPD